MLEAELIPLLAALETLTVEDEPTPPSAGTRNISLAELEKMLQEGDTEVVERVAELKRVLPGSEHLLILEAAVRAYDFELALQQLTTLQRENPAK